MAIKPVIAGTDGSDGSAQAVAWAIQKAVRRHVPAVQSRRWSACLVPRTSWSSAGAIAPRGDNPLLGNRFVDVGTRLELE